MPDYVPRLVDGSLQALLRSLSAVSIEGARGVGKTSTARHHGGSFIPVDDPDEAQQLRALGRRITEQGPPPLVLDEWQRLPELWDRVRRAVDDDPTPGHFILTGSSTPAQAPVHTGAGRIVTLRMRPLSLVERGVDTPTVSLSTMLTAPAPPEIEGTTDVTLDDYVQEILCSGFPGIRGLPEPARRAQLDTYLAQTTRYDLGDGSSRRGRSIEDWLRAYAACVSTTASFAEITRIASHDASSQISLPTSRRYRDHLESTWISDPVRGWSASQSEASRATVGDKHQLCDPALSARLLNLGVAGLLGVGHPEVPVASSAPRRAHMLGPLLESLVTQSVQTYAAVAGARVHHLRTKGGAHEVDLIVEGEDRRVVALEIKSSPTPRPRDTRHLLWLRQRIGDRLADAVVITTGRCAYRDDDGIAVVPAALLGP